MIAVRVLRCDVSRLLALEFVESAARGRVLVPQRGLGKGGENYLVGAPVIRDAVCRNMKAEAIYQFENAGPSYE